jgi:hypothetical protein
MDEVLELCRRVLGEEQAARRAAARLGGAGGERIARVALALRACREQPAPASVPLPVPAAGSPPAPGDGVPLELAVARELAAATARLAVEERAALALRDLLGLTHAEIARAMAIEPASVAALLARARLALRAARRGPLPAAGECGERGRALELLARRQDGEALSAGEEDWLVEHLFACEACTRAHAAMLEASACYATWAPDVAPA